MASSSESSFDGPRMIMWVTLLVGLAAAGYELTTGSIEIAVLVGVGGLIAWAALRILLQIRTAAREN